MSEKDYVLGTHDEEVERLGLQHRVWRAEAIRGWHTAGFRSGGHFLDVGCGPGYATLDLAEIAGPTGSVTAVDRSARFLSALGAMAEARKIGNITRVERDLGTGDLGVTGVDGAWVRWVFAFVPEPRALAARVVGALRPGGRVVIHEYFDYAMWRLIPRVPEHEAFVEAVMANWRAGGGEPNVGADLPAWLEELGCEIVALRPIVHVIDPAHPIWEWPRAFIDVNLRRQVEIGSLRQDEADAIHAAFLAAERSERTRMITPGVMEIVARRR